jgi:hypothetical protein
MMLSDMAHLVGRYVVITYRENDEEASMAGVVSEVQPVDGKYRNIMLDWGMGYRATEETNIKIVHNPPEESSVCID